MKLILSEITNDYIITDADTGFRVATIQKTVDEKYGKEYVKLFLSAPDLKGALNELLYAGSTGMTAMVARAKALDVLKRIDS